MKVHSFPAVTRPISRRTSSPAPSSEEAGSVGIALVTGMAGASIGYLAGRTGGCLGAVFGVVGGSAFGLASGALLGLAATPAEDNNNPNRFLAGMALGTLAGGVAGGFLGYSGYAVALGIGSGLAAAHLGNVALGWD